MKQCTGLWIVAPINRAVDDKAAKSLLGESFKRQLKMDGGFSTVTFICSKTDDISLIEAQDSLGLEEEMEALWGKSDANTKKKKALKTELDELKDTKSDVACATETADQQIDIWDTLKDELEDGKVVFAPSEKPESKKRKRGKPSTKQKKKARKTDSDDDSDYAEATSDEDDVTDDAKSEDEQQGDPLTEEQITTKIAKLKAVKKEGRQQRAQLDERIRDIRGEISVIDKAEEKIQAEMSAICISGRNQYSKGAIQQDFAAGIKELDQELAEEEDSANFNPDVDTRDYDQVAKSLPVFCVSSRGYQKLQGRLRKDPNVPGCKAIEETEIPQLQAHCQKLTEAGREVNCRRFLNSLSQLLNSLRLWSSNDGSGGNMTQDQKARETRVLQDKLQKLDTDLDNSIKNIRSQLGKEINEQIQDKFDDAITSAETEAEPTVLSWGQPVNRNDRAAGGYYWATYKAICRRFGVYSNAQGPHDWNTQLADPMLKVLAPGWERTFSRRVPSVLEGLARGASALLDTFHREVEARAARAGASHASFQMLKHQLPTYKQTFKDLAVESRNIIANEQKEINRAFVPVVTEAMSQVYDDCEAERGPGQFMRMKALMTRWIHEAQLEMFHDSTSTVGKQLKKLLKDIEETMLAKADDVFLSVKRDYSSVVVGKSGNAAQGLPRAQRHMRQAVLHTVEGTEINFKRLVGLEPGAEESESESNEDENGVMDADKNEDRVKAEEDQDKAERSFSHLDSGAEPTLQDAVVKAPTLAPTTVLNDDSMELDTALTGEQVEPTARTSANADVNGQADLTPPPLSTDSRMSAVDRDMSESPTGQLKETHGEARHETEDSTVSRSASDDVPGDEDDSDDIPDSLEQDDVDVSDESEMSD